MAYTHFIQKPQLLFEDKVDNSDFPWEPRIKYKPNMIIPLNLYVEECEDGVIFNHPYEHELEIFGPPLKQLIKQEPIKYKPLDRTPLIVITKEKDLRQLMNDLIQYNEIAVDLEHHSYHSFQGITCLMQISTRNTDYIIDTLSLRSKLHILNEVFTNPMILKVFHGADHDILWLQKDLSLYVVNIFDTHQAAKQLSLPHASLTYLLLIYCDVDNKEEKKKCQLADWRSRPLSQNLIKYAREDTHYLLYIKDILRNILIEAAEGQMYILRRVYDSSTNICKNKYRKPIYRDDSYINLYIRSQRKFNNCQLYILKELHRWRDRMAREEDESTSYVMSNELMLNIAETLPVNMKQIKNICSKPLNRLLKMHLSTLKEIVFQAKRQPLYNLDLHEKIMQRRLEWGLRSANLG